MVYIGIRTKNREAVTAHKFAESIQFWIVNTYF
jgi:hypothetical protein